MYGKYGLGTSVFSFPFVHVFYVISSEEADALCWTHVSAGPPIVSVFIYEYVVHINFYTCDKALRDIKTEEEEEEEMQISN